MFKGEITTIPQWQKWVSLFALIGIASVIWSRVEWSQPPATQATADESMASKDFENALLQFKELLKAQPESASLLLSAGECAQRLDRYEEAISFYERIPKRDSIRASIGLWSAGEMRMDQGRLSKAILILEESVRLDSNNVLARTRLAEVLDMSGQRWASRSHYLELLRSDKWTFETLRNVGNFAQTISAKELLDRCLSLAPDDPSTMLGIARSLRESGNYGEAETLLRRAIVLAPTLVEAHVQLGKIWLVSNPNQLPSWAMQIPSNNFDHPDIWWLRGEVARLDGQWKQATRCYAEAVKLCPDHAPACIGLAKCSTQEGDPPRSAAFGLRAKSIEELNAKLMQVNAARTHIPYVVHVAEKAIDLGRMLEASAWTRYGLGIDSTSPPLLDLKQKLMQSYTQTKGFQFTASLNVERELSFPLPSILATGSKKTADSLTNSFEATHQPTTKSHFHFESLPELRFTYFGSRNEPIQGRRMQEMTGGGIGVLDYDRDGWPDVFLSQGVTWPPGGSDHLHSDRLLRHKGIAMVPGDWFEDVSSLSGIHENAFGQGVAVGDLNNDGFDDIYVANIGMNQLWINQGDGTWRDGNAFLDQTINDWTVSAAIVDLDNDGIAEIVDANYIQGTDVFSKLCDTGGLPRICSPLNFQPAKNRILKRDEHGFYRDVSRMVFDRDVVDGNALGLVVFRVNNSPTPVLFLGNDQVANNLLIAKPTNLNPMNLLYHDEAIASGVAFDGSGKAQACMGIAAGDVNSDGKVDLLVTNFYKEYNTLYLQSEDGLFEDRTAAAGLVVPSLDMLGFGAQFADSDCNGTLDLMVLNGHIDDLGHRGQPYRMVPQFFSGNGKGRFELLAPNEVGEFFKTPALGRALCTIDANRDGYLDFIAAELETPACLVMNRTQGFNFVSFRCVGTVSQRDAIGTTVSVTTKNRKLSQQLMAGNGYMVSNERILHFGLNEDDRIENVEIAWPSGTQQRFHDFPVNKHWVLIEGSEMRCIDAIAN